MLPLATQIQFEAPATRDRRRARRHSLQLPVNSPVRAVVENLSETGIALRTNARLAVGDAFDIDLPLAGLVTARVAWAEDEVFGCDFENPIALAAVSAARLRSPFDARETFAAEPAGAAVTAMPLAPNYTVAVGVMAAFSVVAAMFVAALLTAPFSIS